MIHDTKCHQDRPEIVLSPRKIVVWECCWDVESDGKVEMEYWFFRNRRKQTKQTMEFSMT